MDQEWLWFAASAAVGRYCPSYSAVPGTAGSSDLCRQQAEAAHAWRFAAFESHAWDLSLNGHLPSVAEPGPEPEPVEP